MSFACDTYLRPVIAERHADGEMTLRISRQGHASAPFMPPFHFLHVYQILPFACQSYFDRHDEIESLDAAIRWLTAPVAYDESRLINAMSALENILARSGGEGIEYIVGKRDFKKLAKTMRDALKAAGAPTGLIPKVAELNRRALGEKVEALLERRGISTDDFPRSWLGTVIRHRNLIVHTGISADFEDTEPDTLDHTIWVREVIMRIIFERLGYVGGYRSSLHEYEQWRFPECIAMEEWVRKEEAEPTVLASSDLDSHSSVR